VTVYDWPTVLADARARFHEAPWPQTEEEILAHFVHDPKRVVQAVDELAGELNRGLTVRSPWAVLRKRLSHTPASVRVSDDPERAVRRAEILIRNIGASIQDEYELRETLYARGETLAGREADQGLWTRMVSLWTEQRRAAVESSAG
jgi:hypothetical protein